MPTESGRRKLRRELFERDGWYNEGRGCWEANCAFGCGAILTNSIATLDRYPVMGQHGGKYVLNNLRLACGPCNHRNQNWKVAAEKKRRKGLQNKAINNERKVASPKSAQYPPHVKKLLKENYPSAEGRDVNGLIRMDF